MFHTHTKDYFVSTLLSLHFYKPTIYLNQETTPFIYYENSYNMLTRIINDIKIAQQISTKYLKLS